jgi:hypothetical protein
MLRLVSDLTYGVLDSPQNAVAISQLSLTVIDLLKPGINDLSALSSSSPSNRSSTTGSSSYTRRARGDIGRCLGLSRRRRYAADTFQRLDIFTLVRGALQPSDEIQALDERQVLSLFFRHTLTALFLRKCLVQFLH